MRKGICLSSCTYQSHDDDVRATVHPHQEGLDGCLPSTWHCLDIILCPLIFRNVIDLILLLHSLYYNRTCTIQILAALSCSGRPARVASTSLRSWARVAPEQAKTPYWSSSPKIRPSFSPFQCISSELPKMRCLASRLPNTNWLEVMTYICKKKMCYCYFHTLMIYCINKRNYKTNTFHHNNTFHSMKHETCLWPSLLVVSQPNHLKHVAHHISTFCDLLKVGENILSWENKITESKDFGPVSLDSPHRVNQNLVVSPVYPFFKLINHLNLIP